MPAFGRRLSASALGATLVLIAVSVLFLAPIFWIFSTSFKSSVEIMATPATLLPQHRTLEHYSAALSGDFRMFLENSLIAAE